MNCPCSEEPVSMARTTEVSLRNQREFSHEIRWENIEALMINNMTTLDNLFCEFFFLFFSFPKSHFSGQLPVAAITKERTTHRTIWDFVAKEHSSLDTNLWSYGWCSSSPLSRKITPERGVILQLDQLLQTNSLSAAQQLHQCNRQDDTGTLMLLRGIMKII